MEVWDRVGAITRTLATLPVADDVPNGGVLPGPRSFRWHPLEPATLAWAEALDGGDPKAKVPFRDRLSTLAAPFKADPAEFVKTEYRFSGLAWTDAGLALVSEFDRTRRWTRTWVIERDGVGGAQAVGSQRRGSLRRPRHARCAGCAPRAPSRSCRAATRSSWPAPAPRRRATSRSSTRSASRR